MTKVLITGAAGGIGAAVVAAFLDAGCEVVGLDTNPHVGEVSSSERYSGVCLDVTDAAAVAEYASRAGALSHVVTVAGGALAEETSDPEGIVVPEVFDRSVRVNLASAYYTIHAFRPNLLAAEGDRSVTFISSVNAVTAYGLAAYSAAKAGLSGLMHALLVPFGADGIRVNCLLPGTTPTTRSRAEWSHNPEHFPRLAAAVPLRKLGTPVDVATTARVVALELTHLHGVELAIDGAQSKTY